MSWHEHLQELPGKGSITIASGSTAIMTTLNGFVGDFQPILSFTIAAFAGFFTIWVGWLAVKEKKLKRHSDLMAILHQNELHDLILQKQSLEILNLKRECDDKNN